MINNSLSYSLPYARFNDAQKQLMAIEPIDYFFAKQFTEILLERFYHQTNENLALEGNHLSEQSIDTECIFHVLIGLNQSLRAGHSCLPLSAIANQRLGYEVDDEGVVTHQGYNIGTFQYLFDLLSVLKINVNDNQGIILNDSKLYIRRYFLFEQTIANFLASKNRPNSGDNIDIDADKSKLSLDHHQDCTANPYTVADIQQCLITLFPEHAHQGRNQAQTEIDWQFIAVANALNKSFSVIAGGPGTGKTYTVTKLLAAIVMLSSKGDKAQNSTEKKLHFSLVAPTGKAAQRLSESIIQAKEGFKDLLPADILEKIPTQTHTIHRLLGVIPFSPNFKHNADNLLKTDVLLIDEVSMVDLPLMARLLRAISPACKVILLGDAQQLPSVAAGSILSDLTPNLTACYSKENANYLKSITGCKKLPTSKANALDYLTFLTKSRRFDGEGGIGIIAHAVINGKADESWALLQEAKAGNIPQLSFCAESNTRWMTELIEQYYQPIRRLTSVKEAFTRLTSFRFLSATRKGETGVEALNHFIEQHLFPYQHSPQTLYHGKPIMIDENDYSLGLYNGDIGIIWKNESNQLMAMFEQTDGEIKSILPSRLPSYDTVYAMTIHKTQGSEFNHVAMILPTNPDNQLLSRELLYTGITRAKSQLTIQTNNTVWRRGVENKVERFSGLNQRLR